MTGATASDEQIARLRALAAVLLPGTAEMPAADALPTFDALLRTAVRACGYSGAEIAMSLDALPETLDWDTTKTFAAGEPDVFAIASTLVSAAYYMAPPVLRTLKFPIERQHPAEVEDFVEEYETGILDAVTERGPRFRDPDGIRSR